MNEPDPTNSGEIDFHFKHFKLTPEQIAERETESKEMERRDRLCKIIKLQSEWNAPHRHLEHRWPKTGPWGEAFKKIEEKLETGFFVALTGIRGNGKTQMSVELMISCTSKLRRALFCTATEFFMQIKSTYRRDSKHSEKDILDYFAKPSLLVMDEIGRRGETDWENNLLFELLNNRYNAVKDTLIICNMGGNELTESIGPSLTSRLNETGGIIQCNWESFRK